MSRTTPNPTPYRTTGTVWQLYCEPNWEPPCTARPKAQDRAEDSLKRATADADAELALCDTLGDSLPVDVVYRSLWRDRGR